MAGSAHCRTSAGDWEYATALIRRVCALAGPLTMIEDLQASARALGISKAVRDHDTSVLFPWLLEQFSFQGIADAVAQGYMDTHGSVTWADLQRALSNSPSCPKLANYWTFHSCGYRKSQGVCAEPEHLPACPLPAAPLRNGSLNQLAYSLFLFIRDIARGDLVPWIDDQLAPLAELPSQERGPAARAALLDPLRHVHGVSDKVLSLALSALLIGAAPVKASWLQVGISLIVVDTLVHNFLHRTGILQRLRAQHAYGPACYGRGGCADLLEMLSAGIDARTFNPTFPAAFPRFVQHAVWRYCAANGLNTCNGNRIDDAQPCANVYCRLFTGCDRLALDKTKNLLNAVA
jgi:hypothetical protein